jgi:(1->4)-alpha-D-glucan 1-alpha-D-glucosylmutase
MGLITLIEHLPPRSMSSKRKILERQRQKEILKNNLWLLYQGSPPIRKFLDENIAIFNGQAGVPESFNLLDRLLSSQPYRLAYWRVSLDMINYRRFFSVNDLIGLRVEHPCVFEASHSLLFNLIREGKFGVRSITDYTTPAYLEWLQSCYSGDKVLADREVFMRQWKRLCRDGPCCLIGRFPTGYDF